MPASIGLFLRPSRAARVDGNGATRWRRSPARCRCRLRSSLISSISSRDVVGRHFGFRQQAFHMPRQAPGHWRYQSIVLQIPARQLLGNSATGSCACSHRHTVARGKSPSEFQHLRRLSPSALISRCSPTFFTSPPLEPSTVPSPAGEITLIRSDHRLHARCKVDGAGTPTSAPAISRVNALNYACALPPPLPPSPNGLSTRPLPVRTADKGHLVPATKASAIANHHQQATGPGCRCCQRRAKSPSGCGGTTCRQVQLLGAGSISGLEICRATTGTGGTLAVDPESLSKQTPARPPGPA